MKLPNGFGSVSKLSGKRRRPWIARITDGFTEKDGVLIQNRKTLGYYKTRAEALSALSEYSSTPYNVNMATLTFSELYELWKAQHFKEIVPSTAESYRAAYKHCTPLHNLTFRDIRTAALQKCIDDSGLRYASQKKMLNLFGQMYKYALANDSAEKNYAEFVKIAPFEIQTPHVPFTEEEISILKAHADEPYVDSVLILIYTGWRIGELLELKKEDIDLKEMTMRGGMKTEAGKNRLVPIHPCIQGYVRKYYDQSESVRFLPITYATYSNRFDEACSILNVKHRPHDTRHTFASRADNYGMNKVCIQRIMGHASKSITDKVYTHKDIEELRKAILLLP